LTPSKYLGSAQIIVLDLVLGQTTKLWKEILNQNQTSIPIPPKYHQILVCDVKVEVWNSQSSLFDLWSSTFRFLSIFSLLLSLLRSFSSFSSSSSSSNESSSCGGRFLELNEKFRIIGRECQYSLSLDSLGFILNRFSIKLKFGSKNLLYHQHFCLVGLYQFFYRCPFWQLGSCRSSSCRHQMPSFFPWSHRQGIYSQRQTCFFRGNMNLKF